VDDRQAAGHRLEREDAEALARRGLDGDPGDIDP
jgi:hypothetical protein